MKNPLLLCAALLTAGVLWAQQDTRFGGIYAAQPRAAQALTVVTVPGVIGLSNGMPALISGSYIYNLPEIARFVEVRNFVGVPVNIVGNVISTTRSYMVVQPIRVTVNGKTYEFAARYTMQVPSNVNVYTYNYEYRY